MSLIYRVVAAVGGGGQQRPPLRLKSPPLNSNFSPEAHPSSVPNDQTFTKYVKKQVILNKNGKYLLMVSKCYPALKHPGYISVDLHHVARNGGGKKESTDWPRGPKEDMRGEVFGNKNILCLPTTIVTCFFLFSK